MTRGGHVVYTDYNDMPIILVSNTVTQPPITLQGWKPLFCVVRGSMTPWLS